MSLCSFVQASTPSETKGCSSRCFMAQFFPALMITLPSSSVISHSPVMICECPLTSPLAIIRDSFFVMSLFIMFSFGKLVWKIPCLCLKAQRLHDEVLFFYY